MEFYPIIFFLQLNSLHLVIKIVHQIFSFQVVSIVVLLLNFITQIVDNVKLLPPLLIAKFLVFLIEIIMIIVTNVFQEKY